MEAQDLFKKIARSLVGGFVFVLIGAAPAAADPPGAAMRFYAAGNFIAAADLAETQRSPDSLVFAARALMAECVTSRDHARILVLTDRAEAAAEQALAMDPQSVEARLQLAVVLGVRGREASIADALRHGYARRGKRLIDQALAISPDNPWANALLGGWNLEVIRRGGTAGAFAFGAREHAGVEAFERARTLAPDDPMIALHFGMALLQLNPNAYGDRARGLFAVATSLPARDAFEARALSNARRVLAALDQRGPDAAAALARSLFI